MGEVDVFLKAELESSGYVSVRQLPTGVIVGALRQMYTGGLFVGLSLDSYSYRYCYATLKDAQLAAETWDGQGDPPGLWIKRKGVCADIMGPGARGDLP